MRGFAKMPQRSEFRIPAGHGHRKSGTRGSLGERCLPFCRLRTQVRCHRVYTGLGAEALRSARHVDETERHQDHGHNQIGSHHTENQVAAPGRR
jgi:hypothetical protein